jgi:Cytidylyltransferase family.
VTNLQKRISSGLVLLILLSLVVSSVRRIPDVAIYILALLTLLLSYEYSRFFNTKSVSILFLFVILLSFLLPIKLYFWLVILGCLIWLSVFIRILLYDNPSMTNAEIFFAGYLMIVPSLISGIIIFDAYAKLLILILIAVSFADSSAYFFGKRYGNKFSLKY